jgi:hypothetical protein
MSISAAGGSEGGRQFLVVPMPNFPLHNQQCCLLGRIVILTLGDLTLVKWNPTN